MGSNTKKAKESRKRRHRSRSQSYEEKEAPREKKHRHHRRHKERKREKLQRHERDSDDSDVVEVVPVDVPPSSPPPPPEISGGGSVESLSIKETNKLRAKLGLKPLQTESGAKLDKQKPDNDGKKKDDLGEFYHKPAHSLTAKNQQEKLRSRLSDHREKRSYDVKLSKVKLLGQDESDDDAAAWVEKNRQIQDSKKEAERRAMMLEELDAQFGIGEIVESEHKTKRNKQYGEKHLKGLRVHHDVDTFGESAVILTLEDKEVLDGGDDVLININLRENEKYRKINESKIKKGLGDEELDEFGNLKPKVLLDKYDEELEGEKRESFQIGYDNAAERKQMILQSIKQKLANKIVDNASTAPLTLASDYYNEEEMSKFKKPKKKVRKIRAKGKLSAADLENLDTKRHLKQEHYDIDDIPAINPKMEVKMEDEVDDALERALQKSRRLKQKQIINNALSVDDLVKTEPKEESMELGNIVLNATAEFCRTLGDIPTYGKSGNREDSENLLDIEKEEEEEDDDDVEIIEDEIDEGGKWNAVDPNRIVREAVRVTVVETPILDEEPDVGSGVGAALKLAMSKGYLDKEENNRPSNSRFAHLQAQHYSIEDKTYGDETERGGGGGGGANRRERYAGPITDFKEKDAFKPNVKLEYIDDEGHVLCAKEAFRYLSHKFHGKGPGKNKVEKRLKKSQQEGLMKKMSSTDTPLGTLNMLQSKQKEMQSPYIVLSGGKHTHSTTIAKVRR
ncbi:hypothetical protein PPYR_12140 [Photinus pyralis]|uniref:U4/U6.U5 tri-snRNP-associated protein 1 n=1 Tax=Photinus pyralis TaxID=7054 RepID=A0A1Y1LTC8_PHOPY|nr:U4/U6.U5 tri-snRNP-associated protein 1 [Photinus pyralis]KAB0795301.1 hypothetical protein PPYR_12140 [Photinus pyralis]